MNDPQNMGLGELGQRVQAMSDPVAEPRLRPYQGAPLPVGPAANGRPLPSYEAYEEFRVTPVNAAATQTTVPASGQAAPYAAAAAQPSAQPNTQPSTQPAEPLNVWEHVAAPTGATAAAPSTPASPAAAAEDTKSGSQRETGLQRAINAVRSAIPIVQKLLPLLDGNFATAISSLVVPQHHPPPPPPPAPVNLDPIERGLAEIHNSHRELRSQVADQGTTLKRVEDQLERVREATDRNTLEQQELVEDLRASAARITLIAVIGGILLLVSLGLNVYFLIQLQHILR